MYVKVGRQQNQLQKKVHRNRIKQNNFYYNSLQQLKRYYSFANKMPQLVMRQRVQKMNQYQILKDFDFVDLMSMSQFYEERTFIYSEYLYKEGSIPEEIYLIEDGEFQFTKLIEDNKQSEVRNKLKDKLMRRKKMSRQKRVAIDFQDAAQYNIAKPVKLKQFRVGTIVGGIGQSIGEEEIILGKQKRLYNARCTSTHNKVIVIKKQHITKILNANPKLLEGLKIKLKEKEKVIDKAHKKLQSIRLNMDNFIKLGQQQSTSREKYLTQITERHQNQLKLPFLSRRNQTEFKKKKQSIGSLNHEKFTTTRLSNDSPLTIDKLEKSRFHQNSIDQYDQAPLTFALTAFQNPTSVLKKKIEDKLKHTNKPQQNNQQQQSSYDDYIPLKVSKSWNIKSISPQKFLSKQKYPGMIDSTALIKEKQHILGIRRKTNDTSDRKQFEQRHKKILKQTQLQKQRAKKSSTAHSKQYMEKMLLTALKKAGYQESAPQLEKAKKIQASLTQSQSRTTQTPFDDHFHLYSEVRHLKTDKITMKMRKKRKEFFEPISQILERSPFDECYFGKMI